MSSRFNSANLHLGHDVHGTCCRSAVARVSHGETDGAMASNHLVA
jgi:hypothetical protein